MKRLSTKFIILTLLFSAIPVIAMNKGTMESEIWTDTFTPKNPKNHEQTTAVSKTDIEAKVWDDFAPQN